MQRRCCWPPERLAPDFLRRSSLTSSHRAARSSECSDHFVENAAVAVTVQAEAGGDIVIDRHGREWIGTLKDHADAAPDFDRGGAVVDVNLADTHMPVTRPTGLVSCMRFRQRTKVDLPHPEGPMSAVT